MDHDETGCQAPPEGPILCANNCGFFGSAANMNMCSKCYKDLVLKQEQAQFAANSIENIVNGSSSGGVVEIEPTVACVKADVVEVKAVALEGPKAPLSLAEPCEPKAKESGPTRCTSCKKKVGLTGFKCRCGNFYCGSHRYSDKHGCQFDYRTAGQDAIAKANPVVKADKLDRI